MSEKPKLTPGRRALHLMALWGFAVAQPLYDLLQKHPPFLTAHNLGGVDVVLFGLALSVAMPAVLVLVQFIIGALNRRLGDALFVLFVFALVCLILAPPVYTAFDAVWWVSSTLLLVVAGAVSWAYFRQSWLQSAMSVLAVSILVFPTLWWLSAPVKALWWPQDTAKRQAGLQANRPDVVLVVFDELPANLLMRPDGNIDPERFPRLAALAAVANWYPHATSVDTRSEWAVPAILSGNYRQPDRVLAPVAAEYPNNLFTLLAPYYRINAYEPLTDLCPRELCPQEQARVTTQDKARRVFHDTLAVYAHVVVPPDLRGGLPPIDRSWVDFEADRGLMAQAVFDNFEYGRYNQVDEFIESLGEGTGPALHFSHINLPHMPYEHLPDGRRYHRRTLIQGLTKREGLDAWGDNSVLLGEAAQRLLWQTQYVDTIVGRVVDRLEALGVYDSSLLIVTSDHGVSIFPGDLRRGISETNITDIAGVPLLVKLPSQARGQALRRRAQTVDILPTILEIAGVDVDVGFDGRSLLSTAANEGGFIDDGGRRWPLPDESDAYTTRRGLADPVENGKSLRARLLNRSPHSLVDRIAPSELHAMLFDAFRFDDVDTRAVLPAHIEGEFAGQTPATPVTLAIAVNDQIATITRSYSAQESAHRFSGLIEPRYFVDGKNDVRLFEIVGPRGADFTLRSIQY